MLQLLKDLQVYELDDAKYSFVIMPSGSFYIPHPNIYAPSAAQICSYGSSNLGMQAQIYNPMKIPSVQVVSDLVDKSPIKSLSQFVDCYKKSEVNQINASDLATYAESLVEMAISIKQYPADCFICPLRGAFKPALQLQKMNVMGQMEFLPFTRGSSGEFDDLILPAVRDIIKRHYAGERIFRINIIDTAKGGQGAKKLANLLRIVRSEYKTTDLWLINFFLLHPPSADVANIETAALGSNEEITFHVHRHVVDDLLIEDWDAAIGVRVEYGVNYISIKNSLTSGRLILVENDSVSLVDSPEMCQYIDVLIANALSAEIVTHPDLQFYRNVYEDYFRNR
jgi:hypothetical protein